MMMTMTVRRVALAVFALAAFAAPAEAQWVQQNEQYYLPADHNWVFRRNYQGADRLFNAFDYGHAILYEKLWTEPDAPASVLEEDEYRFLTERLLKRPPRVPLEEGAIEIAYVKLAPEAKLMFEWAHVLHRQLYDVLADERLSQAEKDAAVAEVLAYYKTRPDLAFSSVPKSMDMMDAHYYSLAFRERYPKFNGLIWAYHWLQVGLYEPLMVNTDVEGRTAGVNATVGRFWQMLGDAPNTMPYLMPMTAAVAPSFSERYPEAGIIFDNLHMMHDVISDILTSPEVPRERKREEILKAAAAFRDDTTYAISREEWLGMGSMMGIENMGGPAVGFTAALPTPTVARGASMAGMDHSAHGAAAGAPAADAGADPHAGHTPATERTSDSGGTTPAGPMQLQPDSGAHAGHAEMPSGMMDPAHMAQMHQMHQRMLADPVIRARVEADSVLRGMMEMMQSMHRVGEADHSAHDAAGSTVSASDREAALDFAARLLMDPAVEARIHADPQLHALWSYPAVQRRLAELKAAAASPAHKH